MKIARLVIPFLFVSVSLFSQNTYSKETEEKIKLFENSLAGRVIVETEPENNLLQRMKYHKVKGLSIAVVQNYKVVWAKAYGLADEESKKPVTTETLFEPGSISKSLNAVGLLKLVQDKKLDLYTDINTYLTSWKFPYDSVSKNKKITLAQLLSHSAGLTVHGFPGYDLMEKIPTVPQILNGEPPANTPAVRSEFEPGLKFQYSGGGTTISQLILTDVTKQPYDKYMYENVLKPMGMANSFYTQPPPKEKRVLCATGYYPEGNAVPNKFHVYPEQGAAGLWMTPTDLCNYIIETQLAYEGKSAKVLNQEMTKLRLTPYNDKSAGLGLFIENRDSAFYFQHSAGNEGFCGQYYGSLKGGNGVAVFLNTNSFNILPEVINSVASVYKWENFYKPVYKKSVKVPENILQSYSGIYMFEGKWANIHKKEDGWYMYSDGTDAKMYFTSPTEFFNKEFSSEKTFLSDKDGNVTGYLRKVGTVDHPSAVKITKVDTLKLDKWVLNAMGWRLLENREYIASSEYLNRGLQLNPGDLILLGNLAHCHLFNNNYKAAIEIYKAHLNETIEKDFTWDKMIQDDFLFFSRNGFDKTQMDKVFAELKLKAPAGY